MLGLCFLILFVFGSLSPQLGLAIHALDAGFAEATHTAVAEIMQKWAGVLAYAMLACALCGLAQLQLLRLVPIRLIVYGTVIGSFLLIAGLGVIKFTGVLEEEDEISETDADSFQGGMLFAAAAVELLVIMWFWNELRLCVAVLEATTEFLRDVPSVPTLLPLLFGVFHFAGITLWAMAAVGANVLLSSSYSRSMEDGFAFMAAVVSLLFVYFWGNGFVTALSSFSTASATAQWYFTPRARKRSAVSARQALHHVWLGIRYHGGSMALGAFLISVHRTMKILLCWSGKRHERSENDSWLRSCWYAMREQGADALERVARRASKMAYVELALSSGQQGFLQGAAVAMSRTVTAPKRVLAVEHAAATYRFVSEGALIGIVGCVVAASYIILAGRRHDFEGYEHADHAAESTDHPGVQLVLLACTGAWLVAESIMHPVSIATSTILHCVLIDGQEDKDAHVPQPLQRLMKGCSVGHGETDASFVRHYAA
eukprot:TRINITY_DN17650_c0_g2_i2.p1 TRINITY_DN17650_c0_g2~~TRINITY_DN17650_c0_g2_i2.p1  ORF type:complete len:486 (-),score=58.19 TRINITY_DN17650_c0_g2_i2:109-1566(-)